MWGSFCNFEVMKVVTIGNEEFPAVCGQLQSESAVFEPDLIVGITYGGARVAELMFENVEHCEVTCRRRSSEHKDRAGLLFSVIKRLPLGCRNMLRIAEARFLRSRSRSTVVALAPKATSAISQAKRVLVVDDAVDSGTTLKAVLDAISNIPGKRVVATAAVTVTTSKPVVMPDFCLYNNSTLIRFPWAKDA